MMEEERSFPQRKNFMSKNNVTFRLDSEKRAALEALATSMERNLSYIINEAISLYLEIHQWQLKEIHQGIAEAEAGDFATDAEVEAMFEKLTNVS